MPGPFTNYAKGRDVAPSTSAGSAMCPHSAGFVSIRVHSWLVSENEYKMSTFSIQKGWGCTKTPRPPFVCSLKIESARPGRGRDGAPPLSGSCDSEGLWRLKPMTPKRPEVGESYPLSLRERVRVRGRLVRSSRLRSHFRTLPLSHLQGPASLRLCVEPSGQNRTKQNDFKFRSISLTPYQQLTTMPLPVVQFLVASPLPITEYG
jgi:hypothetical protein